ncbi:MAG: 30S ribosomal protein S20 [Patescibacteria group bacterium]|nr:30S ribosomal protein S20 [Patescibacteria group bacterium]
MPVIKSAIKKLRQDKKREKINKKMRDFLKTAIKKTRKNPSMSSVRDTVSLVDKASKKHILHKNKAARIKSQLAKIVNSKVKEPSVKKTVSKINKKKSAK